MKVELRHNGYYIEFSDIENTALTAISEDSLITERELVEFIVCRGLSVIDFDAVVVEYS